MKRTKRNLKVLILMMLIVVSLGLFVWVFIHEYSIRQKFFIVLIDGWLLFLSSTLLAETIRR